MLVIMHYALFISHYAGFGTHSKLSNFWLASALWVEPLLERLDGALSTLHHGGWKIIIVQIFRFGFLTKENKLCLKRFIVSNQMLNHE